jgi:hypothetical protein
MSQLRAPLALSLAAGLTACSNMAIDGSVVDVTGAPIVGANISAVGAPQCSTTTGEDGRFELVCNPDTYTLTINAAGYLSKSYDQFDATERKRYELGQNALVKLPSEKGLLKFDQQSYTAMEPGHIIKKAGGKGTDAYKHYCLDPQAEVPVNLFAAGTHPFFDNESIGWRPFRLDEDGCAYRMSPSSDTRWGVDYAEKASFETSQLEEGKEIVLLTLEPGRYFIADWDQGFFTKVKAEDGKTVGYSGYYVEVQ